MERFIYNVRFKMLKRVQHDNGGEFSMTMGVGLGMDIENINYYSKLFI